MGPKVSIAVLNWNGKRFLKRCFDSLLKQDYKNLELIYADNGSQDESNELMKFLYKKCIKSGKIKLMLFDKNYGVSEGNNLAYRKSDAKYFLVLNNDTKVPNKSFVSKLVETAQNYDAAVVGGIEKQYDAKKPYKKEKYSTANIVGFNTKKVLDGMEVFYVGDGCIFVDKEKIGPNLFPKEYFAYGEDIYLGWRARLKGLKVVQNPSAFYLHYGSATSKKRSSFLRKNAEKNRLSNLLIFYGARSLIKLFPILLLEFLIKLIYSLSNLKLFFAIWSALFWDLKNFKFILAKRKRIQMERKVSDKEIIKFMSYKIFPEHIAPKLSRILNNLTGFYCKIFNIKTYDL